MKDQNKNVFIVKRLTILIVLVCFALTFVFIIIRKGDISILHSHELEKFQRVKWNLNNISIILITHLADERLWPSTKKEIESIISNQQKNFSGDLFNDPYSGNNLKIKCFPDKILIYSVGKDRKDQKGKLQLDVNNHYNSPGDIVLEIRRSDYDDKKLIVNQIGRRKVIDMDKLSENH